MSNALFNYIFIISTSGFFVLFIFSMMSFANSESLQIEKGKKNNSGVMLLVNSIIYLIIAIFVKFKQNQTNQRNGYVYIIFHIIDIVDRTTVRLLTIA